MFGTVQKWAFRTLGQSQRWSLVRGAMGVENKGKKLGLQIVFNREVFLKYGMV